MYRLQWSRRDSDSDHPCGFHRERDARLASMQVQINDFDSHNNMKALENEFHKHRMGAAVTERAARVIPAHNRNCASLILKLMHGTGSPQQPCNF